MCHLLAEATGGLGAPSVGSRAASSQSLPRSALRSLCFRFMIIFLYQEAQG